MPYFFLYYSIFFSQRPDNIRFFSADAYVNDSGNAADTYDDDFADEYADASAGDSAELRYAQKYPSRDNSAAPLQSPLQCSRGTWQHDVQNPVCRYTGEAHAVWGLLPRQYLHP